MCLYKELMMLNEQLKPLRGECTCLLALSMVLISAHTTLYLLCLTGKQADLQPL